MTVLAPMASALRMWPMPPDAAIGDDGYIKLAGVVRAVDGRSLCSANRHHVLRDADGARPIPIRSASAPARIMASAASPRPHC